MAGSLNKVMLIGNLGKDPEFRAFEGGGNITRFPLATSETYTNRQNEKVTQTEWHNIVLRNRLAEIAEKYLKKGDKIFVEGRLRTRSWEDQSGERKYTVEIQVDNMTMLGSRAENNDGYASSSNEDSRKPAPSLGNSSEEDDDLPF